MRCSSVGQFSAWDMSRLGLGVLIGPGQLVVGAFSASARESAWWPTLSDVGPMTLSAASLRPVQRVRSELDREERRTLVVTSTWAVPAGNCGGGGRGAHGRDLSDGRLTGKQSTGARPLPCAMPWRACSASSRMNFRGGTNRRHLEEAATVERVRVVVRWIACVVGPSRGGGGRCGQRALATAAPNQRRKENWTSP